jgi:hypothetical protein
VNLRLLQRGTVFKRQCLGQNGSGPSSLWFLVCVCGGGSGVVVTYSVDLAKIAKQDMVLAALPPSNLKQEQEPEQ